MCQGASRAYSFIGSETGPIDKANRDGSEMMLYQDFDSGLSREHRAQMRREVEHNRLDVRLAAARSREASGLENAVSRKSLAARSAAVVATLLSEGSSRGHACCGDRRLARLRLLCV